MRHISPKNTTTTGHYKFVLFFFLAQIVFANMTMAQNQRIIVGVLENWPPQYMTDSKTNEPTGFAIDSPAAPRHHQSSRLRSLRTSTTELILATYTV